MPKKAKKERKNCANNKKKTNLQKEAEKEKTGRKIRRKPKCKCLFNIEISKPLSAHSTLNLDTPKGKIGTAVFGSVHSGLLCIVYRKKKFPVARCVLKVKVHSGWLLVKKDSSVYSAPV